MATLARRRRRRPRARGGRFHELCVAADRLDRAAGRPPAAIHGPLRTRLSRCPARCRGIFLQLPRPRRTARRSAAPPRRPPESHAQESPHARCSARPALDYRVRRRGRNQHLAWRRRPRPVPRRNAHRRLRFALVAILSWPWRHPRHARLAARAFGRRGAGARFRRVLGRDAQPRRPPGSRRQRPPVDRLRKSDRRGRSAAAARRGGLPIARRRVSRSRHDRPHDRLPASAAAADVAQSAFFLRAIEIVADDALDALGRAPCARRPCGRVGARGFCRRVDRHARLRRQRRRARRRHPRPRPPRAAGAARYSRPRFPVKPGGVAGLAGCERPAVARAVD